MRAGNAGHSRSRADRGARPASGRRDRGRGAPGSDQQRPGVNSSILTGFTRTAHPYRDLDVIDERGPRTNQAVVGTLSLVALLTGAWWIVPLLALQFALGLTLGRRWCLACVAYFELVQPRFGEGPLEDARPPRFANLVGAAFLTTASVGFLAGADWLGTALGTVVAALALLASATGFCAGCEAYKLGYRLTGRRFVSCPLPPSPQPASRGF
jgi:predicted small integral membrane protein